MPNIRIKDIPTTAPATVSGDFFAVDSSASTRKLNAFSPTFGSNITTGADGSLVAIYVPGNTAIRTNTGPNGKLYIDTRATDGGDIVFRPRIATALTLDAVTSSATFVNQLKITNASIPDLWLQNSSGANSAYRNVLFRQNSNGTFKLLTTSDAGVLTLDNILVGDNATGTLLFGTATNSNNGRLQLATHTASSGGIGFGTDTSLYRAAAGALMLTDGTVTGLFWARTANSALEIGPQSNHSLILRTNNTVALTLDTSQNATFSKDVVLGFNGPSVPSTLRGRAPRQGLVFNGSAGSAVSNLPVIGSGSFTVVAWVTPASLTGTQCIVGGPNNSFVLRMDSGVLGIGKQSIDGPITISSTLTANKGVLVVYTRSGTTGTGYVDGIAGTPIVDSRDYSIANSLVGCSVDTATAVWNGSISGPIIYNRALSAAEIKALYENGGPAASDYGIPAASSTSIITGAASDFSSDTGYWTKTGTASIGSGVCSLPGTSSIFRAGLTIPGKRYRITVTLSGGTLFVTNADVITYGTISGAGTSSLDFVAGSVGSAIQLVNYTGTITLDNVTLIPIGAVLAPDAAQTGGGLTWYDTSGNSANITLPASGVAWNVPTSGNLTSSSALNLRAGGTNQNITLTASGSGKVVTASPAFIGTSTPPTPAQYNQLYVVTPSMTDNVGRGINCLGTYSGSNAATGYNAYFSTAGTNNIDHIHGYQATVYHGGSGTLTRSAAYQAYLETASTGNVSLGIGYYFAGFAEAGGGVFTQKWAFYDVGGNPTRHSGKVYIGEALIGSSSLPSTQLYVTRAYGAISGGLSQPTATFHSTTAAAVGVGASIALGGESGAGSTPYNFGFILGAKETAGATYNGYLAFYTTDSGSNNSEKMRVTSAGNVLIGTTVNSSARLQVGTNTTTAAGGMIFGTDTSFYRYQAGGLAFDHTNGTAPALMWRETGTSTLRIETNSQVAYISTLTANSLILRTNAITALTLDLSQNATFAGTIRTAAPVGGTAASWKLGTVATVSPTSPNRTIEVDIGGTIYYIHAKTTNN